MKMYNFKKPVTLFLGILLTSTLSPINTFAEEDISAEYKYENIGELKKEIKYYNKDGKLSTTEKNDLKENTKPEVLEKFVLEKMKLAAKKSNEINLTNINLDVDASGDAYGKKVIDLGDACKVIIEVSDKKEPTILENALTAVTTLFEKQVMASSGYTKVTKGYGNRYFTIGQNVVCGIGGAHIQLENHYKLSAKGITERYGDAYCKSISLGGTITAESPKITDKYATKPGASNTDLYCRFNIKGSLLNVNYSDTCKLSTCLSYKSINKTKKTITLLQKWALK